MKQGIKTFQNKNPKDNKSLGLLPMITLLPILLNKQGLT